LARHLFESEFEVIPSDGAVEVIFIPTSSRYTFSRLSNRSDIFEFGLLSPAPRVRHAGTSNWTAAEVRYMAFRLASEAARGLVRMTLMTWDAAQNLVIAVKLPVTQRSRRCFG